MIQISVDTKSLVDQFDISKAQIDSLITYVTESITASFARRLEQQAKIHLHKTRNTYIQNIKVMSEGRFKASVFLDYSKNKLVKMLEEGATPFDMKIGFENSDKKHFKKDGGWWLTIPFMQGTPDTIGESDPFANIMPSEVYEEVKAKPADIPTTSGFRSVGLKFSEIPEQYQPPKTRAAVTNPITNEVFAEYKNKTSIYQGLVKNKDSVTGQNTYISFRRVSDNSDPNAFIFSGITAYDLCGKAMQDLESNMGGELNAATNAALATLGFK